MAVPVCGPGLGTTAIGHLAGYKMLGQLMRKHCFFFRSRAVHFRAVLLNHGRESRMLHLCRELNNAVDTIRKFDTSRSLSSPSHSIENAYLTKSEVGTMSSHLSVLMPALMYWSPRFSMRRTVMNSRLDIRPMAAGLDTSRETAVCSPTLSKICA